MYNYEKDPVIGQWSRIQTLDDLWSKCNEDPRECIIVTRQELTEVIAEVVKKYNPNTNNYTTF